MSKKSKIEVVPQEKLAVAKSDNQPQAIENMILNIRGQQVLLDHDLARLYGVETKRLNEQVKRNMERFPEDFMFQLTKEEAEVLRSQIVTIENIDDSSRSQFATLNGRGKTSNISPTPSPRTVLPC